MNARRYLNVSFLRIFAFLSVFLFHCFFFTDQGTHEGSPLILLSVGVQSFLFLSGFLNSKKDASKASFFMKEIKRIGLPCFYFLIILALIDFLVLWASGQPITWSSYWWTFGSNDNDGGYIAQFGNLWYIPCLFLCYLSLPLLQGIRKKTKIKGLGILLVLVIIAEGVFIRFFKEPPFLFPFIAGYLVGSIDFEGEVDPSRHKNLIWYLLPLTGSALLFLLWMAISPLYPRASASTQENLGVFFSLTKGALGVSLALSFLRAFRWLNAYREPKVLHDLSNLTFWLYLVNETFMCGCFDLLHRYSSFPFGIFVTFVATFVSAATFAFLEKQSKRWQLSPASLRLLYR
ncbi:MAG: Acyltransferase family protein [Tenericutes bacterium ADurb.BinA155]|nr:MAG: Acyltransferase family protein [Tenericutes bacterium ADurb.BinA155]